MSLFEMLSAKNLPLIVPLLEFLSFSAYTIMYEGKANMGLTLPEEVKTQTGTFWKECNLLHIADIIKGFKRELKDKKVYN